MKKIIFIFALVATALVAPAQETVETVVELTNGSIIRGKLADAGDGQRLYGLTGNRNNNDLSFSQFKDYSDDTMSLSSSGNNHIRTDNNRTTSKTQSYSHYDIVGYRGFLELGYFTGFIQRYIIIEKDIKKNIPKDSLKVVSGKYNGYEITTSHGYQFNPYIFLGGGVGLQLHTGVDEDTGVNLVAIPVFIDFRTNFTKQPSTQIVHFAGLKIGSTTGFFGEKVKTLGGYIAPSIGVKAMITPSFALNLSIGYNFQWVTKEFRHETILPETLGRVPVKIGIEF
ncbi:MAG: hypothetical protein LBU37_15440 [Tannerellaceae bacterium]|jgi:hypothetical protein|nr:hypothetical protein [Tannerellaceae bacterium]